MAFAVRRTRLPAHQATEDSAVVMDWRSNADQAGSASINWYMSPAMAESLAAGLMAAAREARELLAGGASTRDALAAEKAVR